MTSGELLKKRMFEVLEPFGDPIFLAVSGSHLYGTNASESDEDYFGVFIPHPKFLIGLQNVEEVDASVKVTETAKNGKGDVDMKFYSIYKFAKLALQNNPTIIDLLFVPKEKAVFETEDWEFFRKNAGKFLHKGCADRFFGYAKSQIKKMEVKGESYAALIALMRALEPLEDKKHLIEVKADLEKAGVAMEERADHFHFPKININVKKTATVKKMRKTMESVLLSRSHRRDEWEKRGIDGKFFMHTVRLLREGIDLLKDGRLEFPLPYAEELKELRLGNYGIEEAKKIAEDWTEIFREAEKSSALPSSPDRKFIENAIIEIVKKRICCGNQKI